jgi:hypothetical protein
MVQGLISFGREREITREMGMGLEASFKEAKAIDYQIAKSLSNNTGLMGYFGRMPLVGGVVTKIRAIKPLDSLESELRTALNNSLVSMVKVGKKAREEKERISQLNGIYEVAVRDNWGSQEFVNFIGDNTDIEYVVSLDGEQIDIKNLFSEVDSRLSQERRTEKKQEYLDWMKQHINLSEQYLESMHALCFVGCEWIGGMSRSYFDLTQLRGGMEEIRKTLENLGRGGAASITSQQAIRQYGTAYINGMRSLMQGYRKMCDLKDTGSNEFRASLKQLENELNSSTTSTKLEVKPSQSGSRLILNSNPTKQ